MADSKEGKATFTFTVGKQERVKVKASEYDAIPVTEEVKTRDRTEKSTYWYAAGTGIVQFARDVGDERVVVGLAALEPEKEPGTARCEGIS